MKRKQSKTKTRTKAGQTASLRCDALVRHSGLYRAKLSCRIGRDALEGKSRPPEFVTPTEYAIYNLLHAMEEIADALMPNTEVRHARANNGEAPSVGPTHE